MKDLTQGSILKHLLSIAAAIAVGMLAQTLYVLIDLYFVAELGAAAVAGVGAASNAIFFVYALTQALGVGTLALIAQATGRKDHASANHLFNQSFILSIACAVVVVILGYGVADEYMRSAAADEATHRAAVTYLYWYLPGLALQFAGIVFGSALRGIGIVRPTMLAQLVSVAINVILAPILVVGWLTGHPFGVAGAAVASSIAAVVNVALLTHYLRRSERFMYFDRRLWKPDLATWREVAILGWPAAAELAFTFAYIAVVYWAIRDFGATAQAGFSIGLRVLQALYLPAFAVAFAATPVGGQNFGAGHTGRVRETLRVAAMFGAVQMGALTLLCQLVPDELIRLFSHDEAVVAMGAEYLQIVAWNLIPYGLAWTYAGMFQAIGNTFPSFLSMASRILTFVIPVTWLAMRGAFELKTLWYWWVVSVSIQCALSFWLLSTELRRKFAIIANPA